MVTDCFYINNNTESVHIICKEAKESYPKMECFATYENNYPKFKVLNVSSCRGSSLNAKFFNPFSNLRVFNVSFYGVEYLTAEVLKMKYLENLYASHNKMREIQSSIFTNTPNLSEIDFSFNQINKLKANCFVMVPNMTKILLSNNIISSIESGTFSHLGELSVLNLANNSIQSIEQNLFQSNTKLKELRLENNPIHPMDCDALLPFMKVMPMNLTLNNLEVLDLSCVPNLIFILTNREDEIVFTTSNRTSGLRYIKDDMKNVKFFNISGKHLKKYSTNDSISRIIDRKNGPIREFHWQNE